MVLATGCVMKTFFDYIIVGGALLAASSPDIDVLLLEAGKPGVIH